MPEPCEFESRAQSLTFGVRISTSAASVGRFLGRFEDHEGFDGVLVGDVEGTSTSRSRLAAFTPVEFKPTGEDLLVTAIPERAEWEIRCETLDAAGFPGVDNFNRSGRTYIDPVAIESLVQNAPWP